MNQAIRDTQVVKAAGYLRDCWADDSEMGACGTSSGRLFSTTRALGSRKAARCRTFGDEAPACYLRRIRQSNVEPAFGNLIHHYSLRRMNVHSQAGAHKTRLLTAVAYHLKKLLRY